jgi:hypothetical protein
MNGAMCSSMTNYVSLESDGDTKVLVCSLPQEHEGPHRAPNGMTWE